MSANKLLRVIGLTLILLVTLVGQGQAQGQEPPRLVQPAAYPPATPPVTDEQKGGIPIRAQIGSDVNTNSLTLGAPGLSYRYVQTFGVAETPYIADNTHINFPWGIATDGADVLIGEFFGNRVMKYTNTGSFVNSLGRAGINFNDGDFSGVFDMAVDSGGTTWVADVNNSQVYRFDNTGAYLDKFKDGAFKNPSGIAFDSAGNVYISEGGMFWSDDYGGQRVQVYDSAGNYLSTIGTDESYGTDNSHFHGPQHIAIYSNTLYVADGGNQRVQIFNISTPASPVYSATLGTAGESGDDNFHFNHPVGLAVDANYIYVADRWNNRVQIFSRSTRTYVATIGVGSGTANDQFNNPTDVALDSAGNIYVADFANCRVQQFNSSRVYQRTFGATGVPYITDAYHYNTPSGVAIANDGSIYLTEDNGHRLIKLNSAGVVQWTVGVAGRKGDFFDTTNENLNNPSDVVLDASGRVYVADQYHGRVQIFNSNGSYYATLGSGTDNYDFWDPSGLAIGPNGYIYVADSWRHRVQIFDTNRTFVASLGVTDESGSDDGHFNGPQDVAVDSNGQIYVADTNNHRVQVFNSNRTYLRAMGISEECGSQFDHFCSPTRLLIDPSNRLYVADNNNSRVQVFDSSGAYLTTLGGSWGSLTGQFRGPQGLAVDTAGNLYITDWGNARIQKFAPGVTDWRQKNINGFGNPGDSIGSLGSFGGQLYVGTFNNNGSTAQLWRSNGGQSWSPIMTDGFGDATNTGIDHLIEFNGMLYAGTWNSDSTGPYYTTGGQVWRSPTGNPGDWTKVVDAGFGDPTNGEVFRLAVFNNQIYASTYSYSGDHGGEIWRSPTGDDGDWTRVVANGLGDPTNISALTFEVFKGVLYAGSGSWDTATNQPTGCEIWRSPSGNAGDWTRVVSAGLGGQGCRDVFALAAFGDALYAGTKISDTISGANLPGQVWRCMAVSDCDQATDWTLLVDDGFGSPLNDSIRSLRVFAGQLYALTHNTVTGMEVWRTSDGIQWNQVGFAGWGDSNNISPYWDNSLTVYNNSLFVGTENLANGGEVWQFEPPHKIYLPLIQRNFPVPISSAWTEFSSPITGTLNALDMVSSNNGWAVGEGGSILRWNGTSWSTTSSPTSNTLNSIDLFDSTNGWAVGDSGVILHFNGSTWVSTTSPSTARLNKVAILAANNAWAVGDGGVMLHWDGNNWTSATSPTSLNLEALAFINNSNGWAIGSVWVPGPVLKYESVFLHWNGTAWIDSTPFIPVKDSVYDIDFVDANFGIAVGHNNVEFRWNGSQWHEYGELPMMAYKAIDLLSTTDGWSVGWAYGQDNNIQHWNGSAWASITCPTDKQLNDVYMINTSEGWAVGDNGTILKYGH